MYLLPVKTEIDFREGREKKNPEITYLLRYWHILGHFGGKTLHQYYFIMK